MECFSFMTSNVDDTVLRPKINKVGRNQQLDELYNASFNVYKKVWKPWQVIVKQVSRFVAATQASENSYCMTQEIFWHLFRRYEIPQKYFEFFFPDNNLHF